MKKNFDVIKANIVNNFLIRNYLWTCVTQKNAVFNDMNERSPFPFNYDYDNDILIINLGNNVDVSINFTWELKDNNLVRLIKIS